MEYFKYLTSFDEFKEEVQAMGYSQTFDDAMAESYGHNIRLTKGSIGKYRVVLPLLLREISIDDGYFTHILDVLHELLPALSRTEEEYMGAVDYTYRCIKNRYGHTSLQYGQTLLHLRVDGNAGD